VLLLIAVEEVGEGSAEEGGDYSGRSLVASQPDLVAGSGDGGQVELVVPEDGLEVDEDEEFVQLQVARRVPCLGGEEVLEGAVLLDVVQRPVGVFAAAVDVLEGLLVQESGESVPLEDLLQDLHQDHVLVDGCPCVVADRADLELVEGHFVVLCLQRDADLVQLLLHLKQRHS
jgi:hypothetical protein